MEENKKIRFRYFLTDLLIFILALCVAAGIKAGVRQLYRVYLVHTAVTEAGDQDTGVAASTNESEADQETVIDTDTLTKMKTIEDLINTYYYTGGVSKETMQDSIYRGMVEALDDPYSEYYSKEDLEDAMDKSDGVSYGIGAYITLNEEYNMAMIAGVMEGTPAEEAGILEGDIIYKIDDESTAGMSTSEVVSKVKGKENTQVHLTIYREGESDYLEMDITRQKLIEADTVKYGILDNDIGYLIITEFDEVTTDQFTEAAAELKENNIKGLILDLRSNTGGNLDSVVQIAKYFVPEGLIVYTKDKEGNTQEYTSDGSKQLQIPIVVLVNGYTASASEILSGAIQDYGTGTLVGTTTFGKGIVQRIIQLSDGTAVKLTVSSYFTPNGRNIHGVGITPDIEVEFDREQYEADGTDAQMDKALEVIYDKLGIDE